MVDVELECATAAGALTAGCFNLGLPDSLPVIGAQVLRIRHSVIVDVFAILVSLISKVVEVEIVAFQTFWIIASSNDHSPAMNTWCRSTIFFTVFLTINAQLL
jgi:hypothetical protein